VERRDEFPRAVISGDEGQPGHRAASRSAGWLAEVDQPVAQDPRRVAQVSVEDLGTGRRDSSALLCAAAAAAAIATGSMSA
jgi:hypothetical protein